MQVLILYDSFYGNTEQIAKAMAGALPDAGVRLVRADDWSASALEGVTHLIVGSPTRAFRPSQAITAILKGLPASTLSGVHTAAFDTRADLAAVNSPFLNGMVKWFGYAAEPLDKLLIRKGGIRALPPAGFLVTGKEGPLQADETEKAARWIAGLH